MNIFKDKAEFFNSKFFKETMFNNDELMVLVYNMISEIKDNEPIYKATNKMLEYAFRYNPVSLAYYMIDGSFDADAKYFYLFDDIGSITTDFDWLMEIAFDEIMEYAKYEEEEVYKFFKVACEELNLNFEKEVKFVLAFTEEELDDFDLNEIVDMYNNLSKDFPYISKVKVMCRKDFDDVIKGYYKMYTLEEFARTFSFCNFDIYSEYFWVDVTTFYADDDLLKKKLIGCICSVVR